MRVIETHRHLLHGRLVHLRELTPADAHSHYVQWMNDPHVNRFLESRFTVHSEESIRSFVEEKLASEDNLFLAIICNEDQHHVGNIKLGPINPNDLTADIGIVIGSKAHWGKGLASESIQLLTDYAFTALNLHKLTAGCHASNPASAGAFFKAGFIREGILRRHHLDQGHYVDAWLLGLLREEYRPASR